MKQQFAEAGSAAMIAVVVASLALQYSAHPETSGAESIIEINNAAFRLAIEHRDTGIHCVLHDRATGFVWSEGPYMYHAATGDDADEVAYGELESASVSQEGDGVRIRGTLAGLDVTQTIRLPDDAAYMEERVVIANTSGSVVSLSDLEMGFRRRVSGPGGKALPAVSEDRFVAIPFRHRADDPPHLDHDFPVAEIGARGGFVYGPAGVFFRRKRFPSDCHVSDGWAWTHGDQVLGIFSFNQEHMCFSTLCPHQSGDGVAVRFGGARLLPVGPSALRAMVPGASVDLGTMRYVSLNGGYVQAMYAYREMLDEQGCRFPPDYDPPVHWNQLFDMAGAWNNRAENYTRSRVMQQAQQARDYSCESLYLDPGWDTRFGSFIWGEDWLGDRREFIEDVRDEYGLAVSLHCPLPPWASTPSMAMGPSSVDTWPRAARRQIPADSYEQARVPALRDGCRNLSLLPDATATASSVIEGYWQHQIEHLNDGWYGNANSWIAEKLPAWAQVDLGAVHEIDRVCLSNDVLQEYNDRSATDLHVLVSTASGTDSGSADWREVAEYHGEGLQGTEMLTFEPTPARRIRVEITQTKAGDMPRLDEIEIYEATPVPAKAAGFENEAKRGEPAARGPLLCLGSTQYRDEAEKRLLANCRDGVAFLMFDGTWWNGPCGAADHGHPVPYRIEDHMRSCVDLAQRIHSEYPDVLIEMHDMLAGGAPMRMTPVYYKYGLAGSYDENWGFELMWNPMADLKERRALALYYYNLSCNVPVYLHIDLRTDNEHSIVLWWYASTCRHLGIGGTHANPAIVENHKQAMSKYQSLEAFYKRGEFFGITEEIHVHVLPEHEAFVVNVFNLSDTERTVRGEIQLDDMGLKPGAAYTSQSDWARTRDGKFTAELKMAPWSARVAEFRASDR